MFSSPVGANGEGVGVAATTSTLGPPSLGERITSAFLVVLVDVLEGVGETSALLGDGIDMLEVGCEGLGSCWFLLGVTVFHDSFLRGAGVTVAVSDCSP